MLSPSTFGQIVHVTEQALEEVPSLNVIGRVSIIRSYAQLLALDPSFKEYEQKLAKALLDLARIANGSEKSELITRIQALVEAINSESRS